MGRQKTISDDDVLAVAREMFQHYGHTVTTRQIAEAAGISEPILYQRFGSKDDLFFAAMRPTLPDLAELLGPEEPQVHAREYVLSSSLALGRYFAGVIPIALRVMTHPSFDPAQLTRIEPGGSAALRGQLARRLQVLEGRGELLPGTAETAARILISLAHDWALGSVLAHDRSPAREGVLGQMVASVWQGLEKRT